MTNQRFQPAFCRIMLSASVLILFTCISCKPAPPATATITPRPTVPPTATVTPEEHSSMNYQTFIFVRLSTLDGDLDEQIAAEVKNAQELGFKPFVELDAQW
jgi:hypothetical protein